MKKAPTTTKRMKKMALAGAAFRCRCKSTPRASMATRAVSIQFRLVTSIRVMMAEPMWLNEDAKLLHARGVGRPTALTNMPTHSARVWTPGSLQTERERERGK